ncbi:PhoX family protein [Solicola gregarius]|uniref:PhoX family phosphatase n=1 Tax=Solicola gregarius TaxID=2908642 RepID=A0AA46TF67_9ACTN|nr:PhoX family phosphatase [Solicola gregarius]UYM03692.1 PhoX family phosphatase [Solicola gregarius]
MPRRLLPLINQTGPHGSRSAMTCHYRCGDACDKPIPNTSDNQHMSQVLTSVVARRSLLMGGAAASVTVGLGATLAGPAAAAGEAAGKRRAPAAELAFRPVQPNVRDNVTVPAGYDYDVIVSWGDRITPDAPRFNVYKQTPHAQAQQFGYNCDYVGVLPIEGKKNRAILGVNNEYTDPELMFPTDWYDDATQKRIEMAAHGFSILEIERGRRDGAWKQRAVGKTKLNRRITAETPMRLTGPAAGDKRLRTRADRKGRTVHGTFGNCSGGMTPWGTFLSGEENFNGYFDASGDLDPAYADSYARYGLTGEGRGWSGVDDRFDLTTEPNEPYRHGYVVEIDPHRPNAKPRKLTMLGRFKHEGATTSLSEDGRVVVYLGDDERGDYIYKFVSRQKFRKGNGPKAHEHNVGLLEDGTLYVAKFTGDGLDDDEYDGTGEWIALTSATESYVDGMSVADVLIDTRLAADTVSPTKMDRPEDIERNPVTGRVYAALTNNSARGADHPVDEANPLDSSMVRESLDAPLTSASGNRNGYVLEWVERGNDAGATAFRWNLFLVCGDPEAPETYFGGFPKEQVSPISCPDNVAFDPAGNLWISTDGNVLGSNDGMFAVPTRGRERGNVRQFLTVPVAAEMCGPLVSQDGLTVFAAVQHPGESDGATFEEPTSTWPHTDRFPRPSVICTYRIDNQRIGR